MGIPSWRPVKGFGDVVVALAVAGEVDEFVGSAWGGGGDEVGEVGREGLPLGLWG